MFLIFIGWDSRFPEPADVLRYSLLKHSSIPLEIRYLKLDELELHRQHDPLASTEFTYSRFLVPHLCKFQGTALFLDNDMLCLGDVAYQGHSRHTQSQRGRPRPRRISLGCLTT